MRRSQLKRSGPLKGTTIRWMKPGEPDPQGEPRRYNRQGLLVLRWKVGTRQYVERMARGSDGSSIRTLPRKDKRLDDVVVKELYEQGRSQPEIAGILGCDPGSVCRSLQRSGTPARPGSAYAPPLDEAEVRRLYVDEHLGSSTIAIRLGVSQERVLGVLHRAGITRRVGRPRGTSPRALYETEFNKMKPLVRRRSGGTCEARTTERCRGKATHVHHRKLRSQGGNNSMANLLHVCLPCHGFIHSTPRRSYERGLLVRSTDDPERIRVMLGTNDDQAVRGER